MKNRRAFWGAGLAAAVCLMLAGCVLNKIANLESRGTTIVCFGDSITMGYGAQEKESYPAQLSKMTRTPILNSGLSGDTTTEALKRINTDVLDREPLLVIIEFGGNDLISSIPLATTVQNMEEMIKIIQAKGAMVAIADISTGMFMEQYGREYLRLSKKYKTILIPNLLEGIIANPQLMSDYMHPNAKGYKLITYRVYRSIIPYLNQNAILRRSR